MKLSTITAIAAAFMATANAVVVYETKHYHVTVTAGADGQVASVAAPPAPPASSEAPAPAPAPASSPAPQQQDNNNDDQNNQGNANGKNVVETVYAGQSSAQPTTVQTVASSAPAPSSSSSSDDSGSSNLNSYAKSCVDRHNSDRSKHSAPNVQWNETLASYAEDYLKKQNCVFAHSGGPYGENIAMGYKDADGAMDAWYNEVDQYNFASGLFSEATGHFTQMVWKESTQIGCATVDCGSKGQFMSCEYYPRGNVVGQFVKNVLSG